MNLGAFSVSLTVQNIEKSKEFYTKLGFIEFGGDIEQNWLILKNGDHIIGLFQGMFDKNTLTFNPGWTQSAQDSDQFTDVRKLKSDLESKGLHVNNQITTDDGPGSIMLLDPDGNPILIDQHRT